MRARLAGGRALNMPADFFAEVPEDVLFVDVGSTGCKVLVFAPKKTKVKFLTECSEAKRRQSSSMMSHGIATLAYTKEECEWRSGVDKDNLSELNTADDYAVRLLRLAESTYKHASGRNDTNHVRGKTSIPVLATAGMRLVSQEDNDRVWGLVCGKSHGGLAFAPPGDKCGTIPGTTEAYYEFLANAVKGRQRNLTGIFTIG